MDGNIIKQEFENKTKVKQELGTSGPLENFRYERIEEVNNDCSAVKQESEDSSKDSDTYEDSKQDVTVSIKDEVEIVDNDLDYSEERSYSSCYAESSKQVTIGSDTQESLKLNKRTPELKNDSKLSKDISPKDAMVSGHAEQYNCEICDKSFVKKNDFNLHVECHSETYMLRYINCYKKYLTAGVVQARTLPPCRVKSNKCAICCKLFYRSVELKTHLLVHSDKKPHKCELCSKEFKHFHTLKRHMLIHSSVKQYKCAICCKLFCRSGELESHLLVHSDQKPHKCELCSKEFKRYNNLKEHMSIHSDYKPHKCDLCGKEFKQNNHLKRHMLIHSDKKKCELCSKEFKNAHTFKTHMVIHSGVKQ